MDGLLIDENPNIVDLISPLQLVLAIYMVSLCYHLYSTLGEGLSLYQLKLGIVVVVDRIYHPTPFLGCLLDYPS